MGEFDQLRRTVAQNHPAAGVDHGPPGRQDQIHRLANLAGVTLNRGVVGTQLDFLGIVVLRLGDSHILGQINQHRARPTGAGDIERFLDGFSELPDVSDQEIMLDTGPGNADRVHFLKGVITDQRGGHLAGEHHQRNRIHIGIGDAGNCIGEAGAGGHQRDARFAAGARITIGGVKGGLFMPNQHMFDVVLGVQGVVNVQHGAAWITEHALDAFFLEAAD